MVSKNIVATVKYCTFGAFEVVQDVVFVKKPLDVVQKCANENAKEILCRGNLCLSIFLSLVLGNIAFFDVKIKKPLRGSSDLARLFFFCSPCSMGGQKASAFEVFGMKNSISS